MKQKYCTTRPMGRTTRIISTTKYRKYVPRRNTITTAATAAAAAATTIILSVSLISTFNISMSPWLSRKQSPTTLFVSSLLFFNNHSKRNFPRSLVSGALVQSIGSTSSKAMGSGLSSSSSTSSDGSQSCMCACSCDEASAMSVESDSILQRCVQQQNDYILSSSSNYQGQQQEHHHHHRQYVIIIEQFVSFLLYGLCVTVTILITYFIVNEIRIMNNKRRSMLLAAEATAASCSSSSQSSSSSLLTKDDNNDDDGARLSNNNERDSNNNNFSDNHQQTSSTVAVTYSELVQYRLDHYFSKCKWAKPALLLSFTFVLIIVGAFGLAVVKPIVISENDDENNGGEGGGNDGDNNNNNNHSNTELGEALWTAWTYVADPGTHADANGGTLVRLVSFLITIGGMVIFALMIGIVSDFISEKVDDLKNGKARVIESDHTLMLGWSDKSLAIIEQLCLANESEGGGHVVVLANDNKQEMEAKLLHATTTNTINCINLLGTEVVFRSGNPLLEHELRKVSVATARSIVVLSPPQMDPDEADSLIVRQVLALKAVLGGVGGGGITDDNSTTPNSTSSSTTAGRGGRGRDGGGRRASFGVGSRSPRRTGNNNNGNSADELNVSISNHGTDEEGDATAAAGGGEGNGSVGDDEPHGPHIVVEMQDIDNKTLVELVDADDRRVEVVVAHDIIGRLMIQCARQPGLAHVLENLLGFEGDEFYLQEWPELVDNTFLDVTCRFDDAVPVGIKRYCDGIICINPPNEYIIQKHDKILCLAEDNDTYDVNDGLYYNNLLKKLYNEEQKRFKYLQKLNKSNNTTSGTTASKSTTGTRPNLLTATTALTKSSGRQSSTSSANNDNNKSFLFRGQSKRRLLLRHRSKQKRGRKEKLLFCGWRRDMADMIRLLDELVVEGSQLWLFNQVPVQERGDLLKDKDQKEELATKNLYIKNAIGSPIVRRNLRVLKAVNEHGQFIKNDEMTLDEFDSILILSDSEAADSLSSDSRSLASLLLVQDLQQQIMEEKRQKKQQQQKKKFLGFDIQGDVDETMKDNFDDEEDITMRHRTTTSLKELASSFADEEEMKPLGPVVPPPQSREQGESNTTIAAGSHTTLITTTTTSSSSTSTTTAAVPVPSPSKGGIMKTTVSPSKAKKQILKEGNGRIVPTSNNNDSPSSSPASSIVSETERGIIDEDNTHYYHRHPNQQQQHHVVLLERKKSSDNNNQQGEEEDEENVTAGGNVRQVPLKDTRRNLLLKEQMASCSSFASSCGTKVAMECCDPIGEILDTRTRSLLQVAGCKGYVMSNHIVSMMLASVAEDRDMNSILGELLSAHGSETKFRDVTFYLDFDDDFENDDDDVDDIDHLNTLLTYRDSNNNNINNDDDAINNKKDSNEQQHTAKEQEEYRALLGDDRNDDNEHGNDSNNIPHNYRSFWDIALNARQHREVAFGYKPMGMSWTEAANKGLMTNPPHKSVPRLWEKGDMILVLALEI